MPNDSISPLSFHLTRFLDAPRPESIMFCKRLYIKGMLDIGVGAVHEVKLASPALIKMCQNLFYKNSDWFVGDVEFLRNHIGPN